MEWWIVLLIISLATNYLVIYAYIEQSKKYSPYEKLFEDFEKTYGSIEKLVTKHSKTFKKKGK